jgi:hypothetical protein
LLLGFGGSWNDKLDIAFAISVLLFGFLVGILAAYMPMRVLGWYILTFRNLSNLWIELQ